MRLTVSSMTIIVRSGGAAPKLPEDPAAISARDAIDSGMPVVFLLGRAGTGKTFFVRDLIASTRQKNQAVLAPTGVAALTVGGQTIHSFFKLPTRLLVDFREDPSWFFRRAVQKLDRLIIDEVSMVRADVIDAMDRQLRAARKKNLPFGGVQMLFVGDFFQLPPVTRGEEWEIMAQAGYETPFAFSARVFREVEVEAHELTVVRRQTDHHFVGLLRQIRDGDDIEEAVEEINKVCVRPPDEGAAPIRLCATNAVADRYNERGLAALQSPAVSFNAKLEGDLGPAGGSVDRFPSPTTLVLKEGARVMFTRNDTEERWVNGTLGTVTDINEKRVMVTIDGREGEVEVKPVSWERMRYQWDETTKSLGAETIGKFTQVPLTWAWAVTIHKAQGLTLDAVEIDLGSGAFAAGQTYVALSRARSMAGLRLARPLRPSDVSVDYRVADGVSMLRRG
jgi:ATP-dependent DNA helicase PIF1